MKKRIFIVAGLVVLIIGGFMMMAKRIRPEPMLEGRRLSEWITDIVMRHDAAHARLVLQDSGTNEVPLLIQWAMETGPVDPSLKTKIVRQVNTEIGWLRARGMTNLQYMTRNRSGVELAHQTLGHFGLPQLSAAGKTAAVQQLMPMLTSTNEDIAGDACFLLSKLAPESVDPLLALLGGNNDDARETAAASLGMMGTNAAPAIPALRKFLSDPRLSVRIHAATALNEIGENPMSYLPAMVQGIADLKDPGTLYVNLNEAMQKFSRISGQPRPPVAGQNGTNAMNGVVK